MNIIRRRTGRTWTGARSGNIGRDHAIATPDVLLDGSPLKPIQRWLWVLSTGGTLLDGFVIFVLGVAMPLITVEFHLTLDVVGLIGASLVFGAVFGAGLGGPMADHLGRKKLMFADMIIIAVGVGVGIDFPTSSSYVSEVLPKRSRARMMVATIACQSVGMLLAAMIMLMLLKNAHSGQIWRLFWQRKASLLFSFSCSAFRNQTVRIG